LAAVAERGGRRLQLWVLPSNAPMRGLLQQLVPEALFCQEDELLRVDVPLSTRSGQDQIWQQTRAMTESSRL
jgi:hypothetical protein